MSNTTTITSKGQVAIPKMIRDRLHLKSRDRLRFTVEGKKIIAEPIGTVDQFFGIFTGKAVSKEEIKTIVAKRYIKKYPR